MTSNVIEFISKDCKNRNHLFCYGIWAGLGIEVICECRCHKIKNNAAIGFGRPDSAASGHHLLEVTNRSD
jgi:hypothetical protein